MSPGLLEQRLQSLAVELQALQAGHGSYEPRDDLLPPLVIGDIDQPAVAASTHLDSVEFVGKNVHYFPHHTIPVVAVAWEGALALGVFGLCRDDDTAREFYKENIQFVSFVTVPTLGTCSCFLKTAWLSGQNCTHPKISSQQPHSPSGHSVAIQFTAPTSCAAAISAKPIKHHTAKAFIRSTAYLGGGR